MRYHNEADDPSRGRTPCADGRSLRWTRALPARVPGQVSGSEDGLDGAVLVRAADEPHGRSACGHWTRAGDADALPGQPV